MAEETAPIPEDMQTQETQQNVVQQAAQTQPASQPQDTKPLDPKKHERRETLIHSIVFAAVLILFCFAASSVLIATAFLANSSVMAYVLIIIISIFLGVIVYFVMEERSTPGHITEAGLLMPLPALISISIIVLIINNLVIMLRTMYTDVGMTGGGVLGLFNPNMPNFAVISATAFVFFNIPLFYLLIKKHESKELLWYLLAPVITGIILSGVYFTINAIFGGFM